MPLSPKYLLRGCLVDVAPVFDLRMAFSQEDNIVSRLLPAADRVAETQGVALSKHHRGRSVDIFPERLPSVDHCCCVSGLHDCRAS